MSTTTTLEYLAAIRDVRELSAALHHYCNGAGLAAIERVAASLSGAAFSDCGDDVTSQMLLVLRITQQELSRATYKHIIGAGACGRSALQAIADAVLAQRLPLQSEQCLTNALSVSSTTQVLAARYLCLTGLVASLDATNCFSLFRFADECALRPLRAAAEAHCLASLPLQLPALQRCFQQPQDKQPAAGEQAEQGQEPAVPCDAAGFAELSEQQLRALLESDGLEVVRETDVFAAAAAWACARPDERRALLGGVVQRCVRCGAMELRELEALDQAPQVLESQELTRIVAHAYVSKIMGARGGGGSSCRVRPSVLRARDGAGGVGDVDMGAAAEMEVEAEVARGAQVEVVDMWGMGVGAGPVGPGMEWDAEPLVVY